MFWLTFPFILAVVAAIVSWQILSRRNRSPTFPPGPPPDTPKGGNLDEISRAGSLHEYLAGLHTRYGSIVSFWWKKMRVVSICSSDHFKLQTKLFDRPEELFRFVEPLVGKRSIQFANGIDGKFRRKQYDSYFSIQACENYIDTLLEVGNVTFSLNERGKMRVGGTMANFAIHAISKCCFGEMSASIIADIVKSYDIVMDGLNEQASSEGFDSALETLKGCVKELVENRLESHTKDGLLVLKASDDDKIFIDAIIETWANEVDNGNIDSVHCMEFIQADTISYFIGGFHTTAYMLTWCLYFLAKHAEVQRRVRDELAELIGDGSLSCRNYSGLKYCRAVLDETLRCAKVAPFAARCSEDEQILGGYKIPPGTPVIQAIGVSMDDPQFFPRPSDFNPERFLSSSGPRIPSTGFIPFGFAGKRKCPGYRFSYMEALVMLYMIIGRYQIRLADTNWEAVPKFGFVTKLREDFDILLEDMSMKED